MNIEDEFWMDYDDRSIQFNIECDRTHNFDKDYTVGIKHRPKKADVHNDVSVNTPYYFNIKEKLAKFAKYELDHKQSLNSFSDDDRKARFIYDRYMFNKNFPYYYDHRQFDLPLDLMLYIYCVDHNIDLEMKPDHPFKYLDHDDIFVTVNPDYRIDDKYICIRPSYWYNDSGDGKSPYPVFWFILDEPWKEGSREKIDNDFKKIVESGKAVGIKYYDENSKFFENINQYIYDNYSDDYVPLFLLGIPFPWPNSDLHDTSPMGLVRHFHKSIFEARHGNEPTALEVWDNKDIFKRLALNRLYFVGECGLERMRQGLNIAKIATKVSVFKSSLADRLIKTYLWDAKEIFDPFSGFSGRMLGAFINHIPYIGRDLSEIHIKESLDLASWWNLNRYPVQYDLAVADAEKIYGAYDCLLTCSPYATIDKSGNKHNIEDWNNEDQQIYTCDEWIDICLQNFRCRKYVFVVDDTIRKYAPYIAGVISNYGHMGRNTEYIIYIDFTNYDFSYINPNGFIGYTPFNKKDDDGYTEIIGRGVTPYDIRENDKQFI